MSRQDNDLRLSRENLANDGTNSLDNELAQIFSSIPFIDSSSTDLSRTISPSESDFLPSFQDNLNRQSDDDLLFLEWDKERHLFQDYINSLRKEIRVLLQERLEYQQNDPKQTNDEQMKLDLLQKSLEEKNFIIEQFQSEYELTKEKNNKLIQKISLTQCDTKSYIGIVDELKQKIADLTIDLQNHVLVKRRLEMSIENLENDCKMIDTERIRLTNDIKQSQHQQQDLEKSLQKANVQIAEQGSTIEMLRSENVQVRSQLSTIQRRMFQEKQQILDYLRQIENDLVEKEQIKQRELSLRQDHEQLKASTHQLQAQCAQLLKTIDEEKDQLQSDIKNLYTHFQIPIPTDYSLKNIIQPLEDRFHQLQNRVDDLQATGDEQNELRENLAVLTGQCGRLEEANQAWQQFHQVQLDNFRNKLRNQLPIENDFSFDEMAQSIIDHLHRSVNPRSEISLSHAAQDTPLTPSDEISIQSTPSLLNDHDAELQQLRQTNALLTMQNSQLDQANRAWQQFQLAQLDSFRNHLRDYLILEENTSFDQAAQLIIDLINKQREEFHQRYEDLRSESTANLETIKQSYINTVDELSRELSILKEELDQRRNEISVSPVDILRNRLGDSFPINYDLPLEDIAQQLIEEREQMNERYQTLEKEHHNLQLESDNNLETIRQSYLNTIDELNRELLALKEQFANSHPPSMITKNPSESSSDSNSDDLDQFRKLLPVSPDATLDEILSSIHNFLQDNNTLKEREVSLIQNLEGVNQQLINIYQQCEQLQEYNQQLLSAKDDQENYLFLQSQCTQLDTANRAWQQFYDNQLNLIRDQLKDYVEFDPKSDFTQMIQTIASQLQTNHQTSESNHHGNGLSRQSSSDSEQIENLQEEIDSLENQLKDSRSSIDSLKNTLQLITDDNDQLKQRYQEIEEKYLLLIKDQQNFDNPSTDEVLRSASPNEDIQRLELFRAKLEESIAIDPNSSLEQIAETILHRFDSQEKQLLHYQSTESILAQNLEELNVKLLDLHRQCEDIREHNAQLILSKQQVDERNEELQKNNQELLLNHENLTNQLTFNAQLLEQQIQSSLAQSQRPEQNDVACETTPVIHQTESFQSLTDDENPWDNDQYIEQISSLSPVELSNNLHKECEQILAKQHLNISSIPNLNLHQLALLALYSLSNQHLIDEAKQMYNDTVLRALKQEYELISNEKNDLIQQIESNSLQSKDSDEFPSKEQFTVITQADDQEQIHLENLRMIKEKLDQIINQRSELFPNLSADPLEQLDRLSAVLEHQTAQTEQLNHRDQQIATLKEELNAISTRLAERIDGQTQTDDQQEKKSAQINEKLKRALQTIKEKVNRVVQERPECFSRISADTIERIDQLITAVDNQAKQIEELQENLSQKDQERTLLQQRLDDLERQQEHNVLVEHPPTAASSSQSEFEDIDEDLMQLKQAGATLDESIQSWRDTIEQQSNELKDLSEKYASLLQSHHEVNRQKEEVEARLQEHQNQIDNLLEELQKKTLPTVQTTDNESQTDDRQHDKLLQVNNKLKRALQTVKEKIQRVVSERPDLFDGVNEDTSERLDHLISTVDNQAAQIDALQADREQIKVQLSNEIKELQSALEKSQNDLDDQRQLSAAVAQNSSVAVEEHQKQIEQLQRNLSQKEEERNLLRERLNEVELELRRISDDHTSTMAKCKSLEEDYDVLLKQQAVQSADSEHEIQQLTEQLAELQQSLHSRSPHTHADEQIGALQHSIDHQSQQLKDLNDRNILLSSQLQAQAEIINEKKELEDRLMYQNQSDPHISTIDQESQTDDRQHEKMVQVNNKLKRALQSLKDKMHRAATERPDLFDGISEETNDRLDHLIATVEHQAGHIDVVQAEYNQANDRHQRQIKALQNSLEAVQSELENERQVKIIPLVSAAPPSTPSNEDTSAASIDDYEKQIKQLKQNLSEKDEEETSLRERLNEVELELGKILYDHAAITGEHEALIKEYNGLLEQQTLKSTDSQRQIEQLQKELAALQQSPATNHVQVQTDLDIDSIYDRIEQQSEQIKDLNNKNLILTSQLESADEVDQQKKAIEDELENYKHQLENLTHERANLLEEIAKKTLPSIQTTDNESQTDDQQHEKLTQANNKLKRALQTVKEKIQRVVNDRSNLFDGVGEDTSDRLDHLITIIDNQAIEIDALRTERERAEEQLNNEIKDLQSTLERCQNELEDERQMVMEQAALEPVDDSSSVIEGYRKHIEELQENLLRKQQEQTALQERLDEVEFELKNTYDDQALKAIKLEENFQSLLEQQTVQSNESVDDLNALVAQQTEQLQVFNERCRELISQINVKDRQQIEAERQRSDIEQQLNDCKDLIVNFLEERAQLLEEIEKLSSTPTFKIDNESQTDDDQYDALVQSNSHLYGALRALQEKIQRVVAERPGLFDSIGQETDARLDHLISTIENQTTQIDLLQTERDQVEEALQNEIQQLRSTLEASENEHRSIAERLTAQAEENSASISENYQKELEKLQEDCTKKEKEQLKESETKLQEMINNHALKCQKYEEDLQSFREERNSLVDQQMMYSEQQEHTIEQLKDENEQIREELAQMKQLIDDQQMETEKQKNDIENFMQERTKLLEELENRTRPTISTVNTDCQTDDDHHEELSRLLQTLQEKIDQVVTKKPDFFDETSKEINQRLDHLISTIENQATQIDTLQAERSRMEQELTSALTASDQLQKSILEKGNESNSLHERLITTESELRKALGDQRLAEEKYEALINEREVLVEQQKLLSADNEREMEQLKGQLTDLHQSSLSQYTICVQMKEQVEVLQNKIDDESQQLKDLNEKNTTFSSQLDVQAELIHEKKELEKRLKECEHLLEETKKKIPPVIRTSDNGNQTEDVQYEKLVQVNKKLKRALQSVKDQILNVTRDQPSFFDNVSEDTNERINHLISMIGNQATQIETLRAERDRIEEQLRNENRDLQSSLEACRYQIENERPIQTEQLLTASPEDYQKEIDDLRQHLNDVESQLKKSSDDQTRTLSDYQSLVEQKALDVTESQRELEQLKKEIVELKQLPDTQHREIQTDETMKVLDEMAERLEDLNEKNVLLASQLSSQTEQKQEIEQQLIAEKAERTKLLDEIEKNTPVPIETRENYVQTDDDEHETVLELNKSLTSTLQSMKDQFDDMLTERSDLFDNTGEEISERLARLISLVQTQASQMAELQNELDQAKVNHEGQVNELQNSFDLYRQQTDERIASLTPPKHEIETQTIESISIHPSLPRENPLQSSNDESDSWFDAAPDITEKEAINQRQFRDIDIQCHIENPPVLPSSTENSSQTELKEVQSSHVETQTLGLSMYEEYEKRLSKLQENESSYQREIDRLTEERDQLNNLSQGNEQPTSKPAQIDAEIQTTNDHDSFPSSDQSISRRIFEQELLAWSKESEQLKRFVKQIQIENNKLKTMITDLESKIHDYIHENNRLEQENHHLTRTNYSSLSHENFTTSDEDVCYLTLKWLTYEVAQRTTNTEQLIVRTDEEPKQQVQEAERQMKITRVQNERLKNQLETYTVQFKHIQQAMSVKIQEMMSLKDELERLRINEMQSRLEITRLQSELRDDQLKIQQLESELSDLKLKQSNKDSHSIENLRELLQLKERELTALKEKLDYTKQTHKLELQETLKSNQFSLDNAKHFERMNLSHEEKRRELETRLGKFSKMTKALIAHQQNPIIDIEELRKLIAETESEEKVTSSLSPIRDCLSLLEAQMKDLHHNIIENHARRSKRWKYKLGFECLSCESRWEVTHDIHDLQEACLDPTRFLESSMVEPMAGCSCPIMIDFIESDIRLCLDDMINEVCVRTTVN